VDEDEGGPYGTVLVPAATGEEADARLDLEEAGLVRGVSAEAPRPRPTGKRLGVATTEQWMWAKRLRR
jgi:hypothetical protein